MEDGSTGKTHWHVQKIRTDNFFGTRTSSQNTTHTIHGTQGTCFVFDRNIDVKMSSNKLNSNLNFLIFSMELRD